MVPAFGLLQHQVPTAVLKQLVPTSPLPPLWHNFVPGSLTLGRICHCSGATSQLQLGMLLRVTLTDVDLRAGQLPHR